MNDQQVKNLFKDILKSGKFELSCVKTENITVGADRSLKTSGNTGFADFSALKTLNCVNLKVRVSASDPGGFLKLYYKLSDGTFSEIHSVLIAPGDGRLYSRKILFPFPVAEIRLNFIDFTSPFYIRRFSVSDYPVLLYKLFNIFELAKVMLHNLPEMKKFTDSVSRKEFLAYLYMEKENFKLKKLNLYKPPKAVYNDPQITLEIIDEIKKFKIKPLFSVIMPVYNVKKIYLAAAVNSLRKQWYSNWELCIADDCSFSQETTDYLRSLEKEKCPNIKIKFLENNSNISKASNEALKLADGEFIVLMDNDDELTPHALYEAVKVLNHYPETDFIYSDEDKLDSNGNYIEHHFKPDFSPDMLLSHNYISHLTVIRKSRVEQAGGWTEGVEGAQDYDLYLKVLELTGEIVHIPKILYHWRKVPGSTASEFSAKSNADDAGLRALRNAITRRGLHAEASKGVTPGTYKISYHIEGNPKVSIVIPFKDQAQFLEKCIFSILEKSTYSNYEIIAVDNNSSGRETFSVMEKLKRTDQRIRFAEYKFPFNYAAINNYAVNRFADGEHIVFMNSDIEIITDNWIEELLMFSQRTDTACVGAKLFFPDHTIQHAGVIIGLGRYAGHRHRFFNGDSLGYANRLVTVHNVSAVTAALMMIKKSLFQQTGGFDEEHFKIAYNDVDLCIRMIKAGYLNVFNPFCEAYHHESVSRGDDNLDPEKAARFESEKKNLIDIHGEFIDNGDPFYNPNLTLAAEDFSLR
jgi:glycosyltransferase involved in cell wall biosynthesis